MNVDYLNLHQELFLGIASMKYAFKEKHETMSKIRRALKICDAETIEIDFVKPRIDNNDNVADKFMLFLQEQGYTIIDTTITKTLKKNVDVLNVYTYRFKYCHCDKHRCV
jgi:hypothetical protein